MRIVFLDTTMDGNLIGGAQTFLVKIMSELSFRGHELHFISKGKPRAKTSANIENSGAFIHTDLWNPHLLVDDAAPILAKWINTLNPDVYVVSVSPDIGWAVLPYLEPTIATISIGHNDSDTFYQPAKYYSQFLTRVIGVSEEICKKYIEKCQIQEERVVWIPYGVESKIKQINDSKYNNHSPLSLIYVGRLEDEQKRASDIIKIVKRLVQEKIDFKLKVVGDGELKQLFEEELVVEIRQKKVHLLGWLRGEEVLNHLGNSDIFLLTSAYEGFCISLIEAMANGCCPVATAIDSGNKQLIKNEVNGYLLPIGDIEKFVTQIVFLDKNREKLLKLRTKALETGQQYSIQKMVDSYLKCFLQTVNEARGNQRQQNYSLPLMETCRSNYPLWLRRIKAKAKRHISNY